MATSTSMPQCHGSIYTKGCWEDYTPVVTTLCVKIHLRPAASIQASHTHQPKKAGSVNNKAESLSAMQLFSVNRDTHGNPQGNNEHRSAHIPSNYVKRHILYLHYSCSFCSRTQKHSRTPMRVPRCNALLQNRVLISVEQDTVSLDSLTY